MRRLSRLAPVLFLSLLLVLPGPAQARLGFAKKAVIAGLLLKASMPTVRAGGHKAVAALLKRAEDPAESVDRPDGHTT